MKKWVDPTEKQLQKELADRKKRYNRSPDNRRLCESVARVYYWMNDPTAREYFYKAIDALKSNQKLGGEGGLIIGNFYRMAGDPESGRSYLRQGCEVLMQEMISPMFPGKVLFNKVRDLVTVCLLLGDYQEVVKYGTMLRNEDSDYAPELLHEQLTLLSEAKLNCNLAKAEQAIEAIRCMIRSERAKVSDTGPFSLWDAYDIALQIRDELQKSAEES